MSIRFSPADGGWHAVVADRALLTVEASADPALVARIAERMPTASGFADALDAIVAHGVARAPSFALVTWQGALGSVRLLVRGEVSVELQTAGGPRSVSGSGVTTWSEQLVVDVVSLRVLAPGGEWAVGAQQSTPEAESRGAEAGPQPDADAEVDADGVDHAEVDADLDESTVVVEPASARARSGPRPSAVPPAASAGETTIVPSGYADRRSPEATEAPPAPIAPTVEPIVAPTTSSPTTSSPTTSSPIASSPIASPPEGDHDGLTVVASDIHRLRSERAASTPAADGEAWLEFGTGRREALDPAVVIGRAPAPGDRAARPVSIDGGDQDISRTHVRVGLEGGTVVVTDLHSRNGTVVVMPGKAPQRLRAGEATAVLPGTLVDLGSGVTMTVRQP